MAEATTTRPTRQRAVSGAAARSQAAKAEKTAASTKAAEKPAEKPAETEAPAVETPVSKTVVALTHLRDTKNWAVFGAPGDGTGLTGSLYVPLGTSEVRVQIVSPA